MRSLSLASLLVSAQLLTSVAQAQPQSQTACVTLQGNGERYPALLAQVLALLERNVEPKLVFGGSSAAGAAALIRGILSNPSIASTEVIVDGRALSKAEKAARIMATSARPIGTILVLPGLNKLGHTFLSAVKYVGADQLAQAFIGYPDQSIANLEAAVGQITLLTEFFATADFSAALQESQLSARANQVQQSWLQFSDMVLVTPSEFIRALITAPTDSRWTEHSEDIKKRYFDLFFDENAKADEQPDAARARYNKTLQTLQPIIARIPDDQLEKAFLSSLSLLKGLPFVSYTAVVASKPFYLPHGLRVQKAYLGFGSDGVTKFQLPEGTLIHTTARVATRQWGKLVEKTGLEYFYQTYMPSADVYQDLVSAKAALGANESFLQFTAADGSIQTVVDKNHLLIAEPMTLAQALKASVAEPNAFRRDPLTITSPQNETLVSFGGWMEHANRRTIASLEQCQQVDAIVEVSNLSDGLKSFQLKAIRAAVNGWSTDAGKAWMDKLWASYSDSHKVRPASESILLNFDWDNASGQSGDAATLMNPAYDANRNAFFLRAYQDASGKLQAPASGAIIGADLNRLPLGPITDPAALNQAVEDLLK